MLFVCVQETLVDGVVFSWGTGEPGRSHYFGRILEGRVLFPVGRRIGRSHGVSVGKRHW